MLTLLINSINKNQIHSILSNSTIIIIIITGSFLSSKVYVSTAVAEYRNLNATNYVQNEPYLDLRYTIDVQNNKSSRSSLYCTHKFLSMYCDSSNRILKISLVVAVKCTKCISMITNHVSFEKQNKVQCMQPGMQYVACVCSTFGHCTAQEHSLFCFVVLSSIKVRQQIVQAKVFQNNSKAFMTTLKMLFDHCIIVIFIF